MDWQNLGPNLNSIFSAQFRILSGQVREALDAPDYSLRITSESLVPPTSPWSSWGGMNWLNMASAANTSKVQRSLAKVELPSNLRSELMEMPPKLLAQRCWASRCLAGHFGESSVGLYTHDEMADHIESLSSFIDAERSQLLREGKPSQRFKTSQFLDWRLANVYPADAISPSGLTWSDTSRLVDLREDLIDIKLLVLRTLESSLRVDSMARLFENAMAPIRDVLMREEADFLLFADKAYNRDLSESYDQGHIAEFALAFARQPRPGGLTDMIEFIGYVMAELNRGRMQELCEMLGELRHTDRAGDPLLLANSTWPYVEYIGTGHQGKLEAALDMFIQHDSRLPKIWAAFEASVSRYIEQEFALLPPGPTVRSRAQRRKAQVESIKALMREQPDLFDIDEPDSRKQVEERVTARFPSPSGLVWSQVQIVFLSNDLLKVTAGNVSQKYLYAELGFKDGRRGDQPDTRWAILKELARHDGTLSWEAQPEKSIANRAQAAIKTIRQRLNTLMGLSEDPFHAYHPSWGYRTKFQLSDESFSQSESLDAE